jgi:hypothetical protein
MEGWRDGGMEGWRDGGMEGWREGGGWDGMGMGDGDGGLWWVGWDGVGWGGTKRQGIPVAQTRNPSEASNNKEAKKCVYWVYQWRQMSAVMEGEGARREGAEPRGEGGGKGGYIPCHCQEGPKQDATFGQEPDEELVFGCESKTPKTSPKRSKLYDLPRTVRKHLLHDQLRTP